jgi:hypothetical protein
MEMFIAFIAGLTLLSIILSSQLIKARYECRKRHIESLGRVEDAIKVNLPETASELMCAVIDEEMDKL